MVVNVHYKIRERPFQLSLIGIYRDRIVRNVYVKFNAVIFIIAVILGYDEESNCIKRTLKSAQTYAENESIAELFLCTKIYLKPVSQYRPLICI